MDRVASVACPIMVVGVVMLCGGCPTRVSKETPADVANGSTGDIGSSYSITSSARASSVAGTLMPIAFAVLRLMTSSNFVGCSAGISAGLPPFSILITN